MRTDGLSRLEELRKAGRWLFQGDRTISPAEILYPTASLSSSDPGRVRGLWVPEIGLMAHSALVRQVYASPIAAALDALVQRPGEPAPCHTDEFSDGTVAVTFGTHSENRAHFSALVEIARSLDDGEPLEDCFVNVLARKSFESLSDDYAIAGQHVSAEPVRIEERVALTAGDLRALAPFLEEGLVDFTRPQVAQANPFTGLFSRAGHLQFRPDGERVAIRKSPSKSDRAAGLSLLKGRGHRWLKRMGQRGSWTRPGIDPRDPSARRRTERLTGVLRSDSERHGESYVVFRLHSRALARALTFIDENCARPLKIAEVAQAAGLSRTRLFDVFRRATGQTPHGYAVDRRLELAERLLKTTNLSIAAISERCGFAEPTSFCRILRKRRGITPSEVRRGF